MASSYPAGLDAFPTTHQDNVGEIIRAADVDNLADATNKIEAELGTNPRGASASVRARLDAITANASPFFDVKTYGAVGDGASDDTAAIQAAINATPIIAWPGGNHGRAGLVWFPPGAYKITSPLTFPNDAIDGGYRDGITLAGPNQYGARLVRGADTIMVDAGGTNSAGTITMREGVALRDLTLDATPFASAKPMLRNYYAVGNTIERVHFVGSDGPAIEAVQWWDSRIFECYFLYCNGAGQTNYGGTNVGQESLRILSRGDNASSSGTYGYSTDQCNNIYVLNSHFVDTGSNAGGMIAVSINGGANLCNRIYVIGCKTEAQNMSGSQVKLFGSIWCYLTDVNITGYSVTGSPISFLEGNNAQNISVTNAFFDASSTVGVCHAPVKLTNCNAWDFSGAIDCSMGTAGGGDTNNAGFADTSPGGNNNLSISGLVRTNRGPKFSNIADWDAPAQGTRPILSVAGVVSDGSFDFPPPIGEMAVDITNAQLYVKTAAATWKKVAVT